MGAHKKQEAKPQRSMRITSGLANLAAMPRDNVESATNEKLWRSKLCSPFPSFVAVRYFKVRPTGAHLISREGKRQSAEKFAPGKVAPQIFTTLCTTAYFAGRQPHPTEAKENSVKDQRRKKLLTRGSRCDVYVRKRYSALAATKRRTVELFYLPLCESNGQPIKGLPTHFAFRDLSPPGCKNSGMDQERPGAAQTVRA
jgi:hypothetical protein